MNRRLGLRRPHFRLADHPDVFEGVGEPPEDTQDGGRVRVANSALVYVVAFRFLAKARAALH